LLYKVLNEKKNRTKNAFLKFRRRCRRFSTSQSAAWRVFSLLEKMGVPRERLNSPLAKKPNLALIKGRRLMLERQHLASKLKQ
jgi:hypothetical protein